MPEPTTHEDPTAVAAFDVAPELAALTPDGTRPTDRVPDGDGAA